MKRHPNYIAGRYEHGGELRRVRERERLPVAVPPHRKFEHLLPHRRCPQCIRNSVLDHYEFENPLYNRVGLRFSSKPRFHNAKEFSSLYAASLYVATSDG